MTRITNSTISAFFSLALALLVESTCDAAATVVDLGLHHEVQGLTRLPDGTALLVGQRLDGAATTAQLYTIAPGATSPAISTPGSLGGNSSATAISRNGQYLVGASNAPGSVEPGVATAWRRNA